MTSLEVSSAPSSSPPSAEALAPVSAGRGSVFVGERYCEVMVVHTDVGGSLGHALASDKVEDGLGLLLGLDVGGLALPLIVDTEDVADGLGGLLGEGIDLVGVAGDEGVTVGDNLVVGGEGEGLVGAGGLDHILFGGCRC